MVGSWQRELIDAFMLKYYNYSDGLLGCSLDRHLLLPPYHNSVVPADEKYYMWVVSEDKGKFRFKQDLHSKDTIWIWWNLEVLGKRTK